MLHREKIEVLILLILFTLLIFLPIIIRSIPSDRVKSAINLFVLSLIFIYAIFKTCSDIWKRQFTTTLFVVIVDTTIVASLGICGYFLFRYQDIVTENIQYLEKYSDIGGIMRNTELMERYSDISCAAFLILVVLLMVRTILVSQKFKKSN